MKVGSLVKNNWYSLGIVIKVIVKEDDVVIYWLRTGNIRTWSMYSKNLEVVCE